MQKWHAARRTPNAKTNLHFRLVFFLRPFHFFKLFLHGLEVAADDTRLGLGRLRVLLVFLLYLLACSAIAMVMLQGVYQAGDLYTDNQFFR